MTTTRQKRKAIRVERYYMETAGHIRYPGSWWHYKGTRTEIPVVCICIDDEAALIEQVHNAIFSRYGNLLEYGCEGAHLSREILESLGILAKARGIIPAKRAQPNAKPNKAKGGK